jgi:murein DD-endopeptidase MepM/ murein hydrolase activator NlpD
VSPGPAAGIAAAAAGLLLVCAGGLGACGAIAAAPAGCTPPARTTDPAGDCADLSGWDVEQVGNAAVIVQVGQRLQVPVWGQVIAVAAAMHESQLGNHPDTDSAAVGLFRRPPDQDHSRGELSDPGYAAAVFYRALLSVDGWQTMPLTRAAQSVQHTRHYYGRWEQPAAALVALLGGGGGWVWPVHAPLVSGFRTPARPGHNGIDLAAARHTTVVAASAGTVATVACNAHHQDGRPWGCDRDGDPHTLGCGWYADVQHPGGVFTRYCHLHTRPLVEPGEPVVAGQPIGLVGSTGNSSGPHLHFEVHAPDRTGVTIPVDPQQWMRQHGAPLGPP